MVVNLNTDKPQFLPSQIIVTNTSGTPEAHTTRVVGPRQGQKKIPMNYKTVKERYVGPISGSDISKEKENIKKLDKLFGGN